MVTRALCQLVVALAVALLFPAHAYVADAATDPPPSAKALAAKAAKETDVYDVAVRQEASACMERNTGAGDCTTLLLALLERWRSPFHYLGEDFGEPNSWTGRPSVISSPTSTEQARKLAEAAPDHAVARFAPAQPFVLIGEPVEPLAVAPAVGLAQALRWIALGDYSEKSDRKVATALAVLLVRAGMPDAAFEVLAGPGLIKPQRPPEEVLGAGTRELAALLNTEAVIAARRSGIADRDKLARAAAILAADPAALPLDQAIVQLNLARAMRDEGDLEDAEQLFRRWVTILGKDHPGYSGILVDRARTLGAIGRGDEALALLDRALALMPPTNSADSIRALLARADALSAQGNQQAATTVLASAIVSTAKKTEAPDPLVIASAPEWFGELLNTPQSMSAATIRDRLLGEAHRRYAQALLDSGRSAEAAAQVAIARKLNGWDLDAQVLEATLKIMAYAPGPLAGASQIDRDRNLQLAVDARTWLDVVRVRDRDSVPVVISANSMLGVLDLKEYGPSGAVPAFQRASKGALGRISAMRGNAEAERNELTRYRDNFRAEMFVDLLAARFVPPAAASNGKTPDSLANDAFVAAQWAEQTQAAAALGRVVARFAAGKGELAALERERESLARQAGTAQRIFQALLGDTSTRAVPEREAAETRRDQLASQLVAIERSIAAANPAYADLTRPAVLAAPEARELLNADEALLMLTPAFDATYVFAVTRDGLAWHRSEKLAEAALGPIVDRLRKQIAGDSTRGTTLVGGTAKPEHFDRTAAHMLHTELIKPFEAALVGKTKLMIVTTGALGKLPLALLVTDPPSGADGDPAAEVATHWLVDRYAVTTLPAVSSLRSLRCLLVSAGERHKGCPGVTERNAPNRAPADALLLAGFGAPALRGAVVAENRAPPYAAAFNGPLADTDFLRKLPSLPGSLTELNTISAELPAGQSLVVTGAAATEARIKQSREVADARYVIFSTHGLLSSESGLRGEPGLVFTPPAENAKSDLDDGLLTASEAAALRLRAQLVVLSACNTAASDGSAGGEGLSGLARGFLFAGARSLMVSHWPVSDTATSALVSGTFARLRAGEPSAKALREAMIKVRANPRWSSPAFWAPFVLVGVGS